jgi:hypothetical protein
MTRYSGWPVQGGQAHLERRKSGVSRVAGVAQFYPGTLSVTKSGVSPPRRRSSSHCRMSDGWSSEISTSDSDWLGLVWSGMMRSRAYAGKPGGPNWTSCSHGMSAPTIQPAADTSLQYRSATCTN